MQLLLLHVSTHAQHAVINVSFNVHAKADNDANKNSSSDDVMVEDDEVSGNVLGSTCLIHLGVLFRMFVAGCIL